MPLWQITARLIGVAFLFLTKNCRNERQHLAVMLQYATIV